MRRLLWCSVLCGALWGCDDSDPALLPDGAPPLDAVADFPPDDLSVPDTTLPDAQPPDTLLADAPAADGSAPDQSPPAPDVVVPDYLIPAPDLGPPDTVGWDVLTTTGDDFVVSRFVLPSSATASSLGVDLNSDGAVDNALGAILAALSSMLGSLGLQEALDYQVYSGDLLQLMRVFSQGLVTDPAAVLQSWAGQPQACCTSLAVAQCLSQAQLTCFSGSHTFSPDASDPQGAVLSGAITSGAMAFTATQMKIRLPLSTSGALDLTIKAAHIEGQVAASGITSGIIAGAIPDYEVQGKIIPAVADQLDHIVKDPTTDPTTKATIQTLFDINMDGSITAAEVAANVVIQTFFAGDVDVDGDGVNELSVGLGFQAVPASITP